VLQAALLAWYDAHARTLPWRILPQARARGVRPDPYAVWVSEIMLQQTTAAAATPRYAAFLQQFPSLERLAAAPLEAVRQAWAGLGYYARARNLHAAARQMAAQGGPPGTEAAWRALPGVGAYTAAAVAAIAFDAPAAPVDANVERVLIRLLALSGDRAAQARAARRAAPGWVAPDRPGDWVQALMDLGADICTPRRPHCPACPLAAGCGAVRSGDPAAFPASKRRAEKPLRKGAAYYLTDADRVWLVRRPPRGLLGGMRALPSTPWSEAASDAPAVAPALAAWSRCGVVRHVFTHFTLELEVWRGALAGQPPAQGEWTPASEVEQAGLPTVFLKAARLAQAPSLARRSLRK
jgi:A/G-specific adenine glycosylase